MENLCNKNITIEYSQVDTNLKLSVFHATNVVQNIMTNLFDNIGLTNMVLKKHYNAAWVISKLAVSFTHYPKLNDAVNGTAFVSGNSKIRLNLDSIFKDTSNSTLFCARQEICPMDLTTRKVRKLDTINYPTNLAYPQGVCNASFARFNFDLSTFTKTCDYTISYCDIDFTRHVNNASYVRFMLNTLNVNFLDNNNITDFEIHYINECREGDVLSIYKQITDNTINFVILHNDLKIIEASFKYNPV